MKKLPVIFISLLLIVSSLWAQQTKMFVKVDRAIIYAEPNENSYKIDTVRSGTVLILFERGIEGSEWIYVTFESRRWKGKVTGFIKADLVVTEEEMLKEEQRRLEEETPVEVAPEAEEVTEAEVKAEAETKPQEELPDLRAAFAKKKPEVKEAAEKTEAEKPEAVKKEETIKEREPVPVKPEEKELLEETPQAKEIETPEAGIAEEEEFKKPKPPPPIVTVIDGITESPQGRAFALTQTAEMAEMKPYAIIKREFKPPPQLLKAEEKIEEEAQAEFRANVLPVKKEEPSPEETEIPVEEKVKVEEILKEAEIPEEEKKELLEEIPQAKKIVTPETEMAEAEEFKKPEPPPPIVTVIDGITKSPQGRAFALPQTSEMAEMKPYAIIIREFKPPPQLLKAEEKIEEEAQTELQTDRMPVKTEAPPLKETEIPDVEKAKVEEVLPEQEEKEILEETPQAKEIETPEAGIVEEKEEPQPTKPKDQVVKPPDKVVKPPEQIIKPSELPQIKQPDEIGLLSFGFGYGPFWGGFGGSVQVNIKDNISIHIGAGLYPTKAYYSDHDWATNEWLYSIGIKYYLPFGSEKLRTYVDLMYGGISVEAVQLVNEIWYYEYTHENIQKTLYGPSLVAGTEWKLGFYALNAYLGLSYNTTTWDYWDRDYFLNGGLGFSLYF